MTSTAYFSDRLPLPRPGVVSVAMNPMVLLVWLYLRRVFACLDGLMADFLAGRVVAAEGPVLSSTPARRAHRRTRRRTHPGRPRPEVAGLPRLPAVASIAAIAGRRPSGFIPPEPASPRTPPIPHVRHRRMLC